ncbi:MAG: hypothetical protein CMM00_15750 [Rhodopirellula sp.]|mgnify:CR=1 FL=1|uniref:Uma2 family endonuclease n=1 Tax=Rhodopirellula TaxID=265488 RepID=UPI000C3A24CD|nr:Uma2 family endonuclease [Rhodopirellula sp. UBA1907]MAP10161.1 hypothetical protein [Rhodopirellula sp.]|tara:strand:- start:315 stop:974 length:660 start_codon:yes stop_codon:yes gene_type:complete
MDSLDELIRPIRHSPQLPLLVDRLTQQLQAERDARERFYDEMTPEQKIEFIDGEVILHSPARNRHLDASGRIYKLLHTFVARHRLGTVKTEKCLCVFPRNDYEPDIVFFGPEKASQIEPETMKFPVPDFAAEILSSSTESRDRGVKFEDYAANGVGEYWIISTEEATVEQFLLETGTYHLRMKSSSGRLVSTVITGLEMDVEAIFDDEKNLTALTRILA